MRDSGRGGSIINIPSIAGLNRTQDTGSLAYSSFKASMHTLVPVMALEFRTRNIRVKHLISISIRNDKGTLQTDMAPVCLLQSCSTAISLTMIQ